MTFEEVLDQAIDMLRRRGRVTYRALKRQFDLDDAYLDDLKAELIEGQQVAVDENGTVLVWTGAAASPAASPHPSGAAPERAGPREREPLSYTPPHLAEKILTSRSALEGEHKQVTVLFCDLTNSTAIAERIGPENMHTLLNRFFALALADVHGYEGTINQFLGDGFMALFGAPIAHEDHARRAVLAALALQRTLHDHHAELGAPYGVECISRMGLNSGLVVVGSIGDNLRMDYSAIGDTTHLASRLQHLAQPGAVVISETTHRLVEGLFETRDLGAHQVKGHTEPVQVFEVLRARRRRTGLAVAAEHGLTPYVGRDRELGTLLDLFQQVKAGQGHVVSITGEACMGKSRLVLEFHRALSEAEDAVTWLEGQCLSFGQAIPFLPVVDQLRENFGIAETDGEPEIIAKVEEGMRRMGGLEAHIAAIRYLLAVDPGDEALIAMEAAARRKRLFDAVVALSLRGARRRPLVLVYEDLHWIDSSTETLLSALMDTVAGVPLLLLMTYRVGYTPPFSSRSFHTTLTLRSLSEADSLRMACHLLDTTELPQALTAVLLEKAEGVPLFVEEVIKTLRDMGVLRRENGGYRMVQGRDEVEVPDTMQGIIMARLDQLGEAGKRIVQLASVIGRTFLVRLLERIAGLTEQLDGVLAELQGLEIIYRQGLLPEPAYVFKHVVIQDVAYGSLLVRRRKECHRAVGYAIEELYADRLAEHYAELAHHFTQGEVWEKAMAYCVLAGDRAVHAFANTEARRHYCCALEAARKLAPVPDAGTLAGLHQKHAAALTVLIEYEAAAAEYQQALELSRRVGDRRGEIELLAGLSNVYNLSHRPEPAMAYNDQALALARELGSQAAQAECLVIRGLHRNAYYGQVLEAMPDAEEALRLARAVGEPKLLAQALSNLGATLQWRAEFDRGLAYLHEGVELARRTHSGFEFGRAAFHIGIANTAKGKYEEALRWYRRISDNAAAAGDKFFLARVPNCIGGVHLELFDLDEALRLNLEGAEVAQQLWPWPEPRGHALLKVGLAHLERGAHGLAEEFFQRAWTLLEEDTWLRWRWHISLLRARGALALAEGRLDEAWSFATQSLELATQTDSRKHVVRAQLLQGEVLAASGRLEEAAQTLIASVGLAERIGIPREVWLGKAALGKVLARLGRETDAEAHFIEAAQNVEDIAANLKTPRLRHSFLNATPVQELYRVLGYHPPPASR